MNRFVVFILTVMCVATGRQTAQQPAPAAVPMTADGQRAMLAQYCQGCHNDSTKSGNMTLSTLDLAHIERSADQAERIIKKLKVGLMPPAGARRPDAQTVGTFVRSLESELDAVAAANVNPGTRPSQRLTRTEYANSIRDILGIDIDAAKYLAADTVSEGFDNIADSQTLSASMMQGYLRAAAHITMEALGDPNAEPSSAVFKTNVLATQLRHVPGAPMGTRGGIAFVYNFPADGDYNIRSLMWAEDEGRLYGAMSPEENLDISIDGERVALLFIPRTLNEGQPPNGLYSGLSVNTGRIFVKTGPHRVAAAFIQRKSEIFEDDIAPIENTLIDTDMGTDGELTAMPHVREVEITGPFNNAGVSDSAPRRRVFVCRPLSPEEEIPCATRILSGLARQAYRRPLTDNDMKGLIAFYRQGRQDGRAFEAGIRRAMEAILISPSFLFKLEPIPPATAPGQIYRISDLALASRLSYFLWGTYPDDELIAAASAGRLKDPAAVEKQVRRMLAAGRSIWLSEKFAYEWLRLGDLLKLEPDPGYYPMYDRTLTLSLLRETELFFNSMVADDRNVLDLLTANDSFADERLALHYGLPNIRGAQFRRVAFAEDYRRGLLGKGAILALTSVADRTSPVYRGKWIMSVLFGTPPPPPPPVVPTLNETPAVTSDKILTVRERMEIHRANAACSSCHRMIDPLGLALENFDVTGQWRTWDKTYAINAAGERVHTGGIAIDSKTQMFDGTPLDGPTSLRQAVVARSDAFVTTLTEKLMEFAMGRRAEYFDMPAIRAITREAAKDNYRFSRIVLGIVNSPGFRMGKAENGQQ
jgi:hypothetical protein